MGTSGSYGGSGSQDWQSARDVFEQLLTDVPTATAGDLLDAIADALGAEDDELHPDSELEDEWPLDDLRPSRVVVTPLLPSTGGSGAGAGGIRVRSASPGRTGSGSSRQVVRGARRGGLAIGAAYALRNRDADALRELGLDLAALDAMSPIQQRLALLDATIGSAEHPDDSVLRGAADRFLKQILSAEEDLAPLDLLRNFAAEYIFQLGLVEIMQQLDEGAIDAAQAARKERDIRQWVQVRLTTEQFNVSGRIVSFDQFQRVAARLVKWAIEILRAG